MSGRRGRVLLSVGCVIGVVASVTVAVALAGEDSLRSSIVVRGGVGSIEVEAPPGTEIELRHWPEAGGNELGRAVLGPASGYGSVFGAVSGTSLVAGSALAPGLYTVWHRDGGTEDDFLYGSSVVVKSDVGYSVNGQDLVAQSRVLSEPGAAVEERFGYVAVSDGTLLSFFLQRPSGCSEVSPCPTLLEYSSYDASNPEPVLARAGDDQVGRGYALLAVNTRGTGCSGGALQLPLLSDQEAIDGAEVVNILGTQAWGNGRVGMVGMSGAGMSQIHVAGRNPSHLAAITPGAVFGDYWDGAYPGGIPTAYLRGWSALFGLLNAPPWLDATERNEFAANQLQVPVTALPPDIAGLATDEPWSAKMIADGAGIHAGKDVTCESNQVHRDANGVASEIAAANPLQGGDPDVWGESAPRRALAKTQVPTLIVDGLQDDHEEIGPDRLFNDDGTMWPQPGSNSAAPGSLIRLVVGDEGHEFGSISPAARAERDAFLDLLVAGRVPGEAGWPKTLASGTEDCRPSYLAGVTDPAAGAAALYAAPPVRVYWENGPADSPMPDPVDACTMARFASDATQWPLSAVGTPLEFRLWTDGAMGGTSGREGTLTYDNVVGEPGTLGLFEPKSILPSPGERAVFDTAAFSEVKTIGGIASADLWITSTVGTVDLEVSLAEIAPDGTETVIETGWRRTSLPAIASDTDPLRPTLDRTQSLCTATVTTGCLSGTARLVRVAVPSFTHTVRPGSRLRLMVSAPGYRPRVNRFPELLGAPSSTVTIHQGTGTESKLVIGEVAGPSGLTSWTYPGDAPLCGDIPSWDCKPSIAWVVATPEGPPSGADQDYRIDWQTYNALDVTDYIITLNGVEVETVTAHTTAGQAFESATVTAPAVDPGRFAVTPVNGDESHPSSPPSEPPVSTPATGTSVLTTKMATFETGPQPWLALNGLFASLNTVEYHSGAKSLELSGAWPATAIAVDSTPALATPGVPVHLDVWLKPGSADTDIAVSIVFNGPGVGPDPYAVAAKTVELEAGGGWRKVSLTTTTPPGATGFAAAVASIDDTAGHAFYVDDVALCEALACT